MVVEQRENHAVDELGLRELVTHNAEKRIGDPGPQHFVEENDNRRRSQAMKSNGKHMPRNVDHVCGKRVRPEESCA